MRAVRIVASLSLVAGTLALAGTEAAPAAAPAVRLMASSTCPDAFPVSRLRDGMSATGWTTHKGTTPSRFAVTVLGVLPDGIAPGIDLILIKASSPAITRAGGIWAGMSGSPIYAPDGRLIGALSYGLSFGPSRTAGVTPAASMYEILDFHKVSANPYGRHLALTPALQRAVVASGAASASAAADGLAPLPTPLAVSGVGSRQLHRLKASLADLGSFTVFRAGAARAGTADPDRVRPGGPIAAGLSYGDFTAAGIGTVTAVCGKRILAFGHPLAALGSTTESAHLAKVFFIQKETIGPPYVMAKVGGLVGAFTQDRLTAIKARLGDPPPAARVLADVTASTGLHRVGRTHAPVFEFLADVAANAVYGEIWSALEAEAGGSARLSWTVTGHRSGDRKWTYSRTDHAADKWSVGFAVGDMIYFPLYEIVNNPFEKVTVDKVTMTVSATEVQRELRLTKLRVLQGDRYIAVTPDLVIEANPGDKLQLRATLTPYLGIGPTQRIDIALRVPADAFPGFGQVTVYGGADIGMFPDDGEGGASQPASFDDVLDQLASVPRNDHLYATLDLSDDIGDFATIAKKSVNLRQVVRGTMTLQVEIPGGEEPPFPEG